MSRPEHSAPPEIFYNEAEAEKYTNNTRMMNSTPPPSMSFIFRFCHHIFLLSARPVL